MRRLIVCCDGTWNTAVDETVTNVRRLANALGDRDTRGRAQLTYYQPGIGTEGRLLSRLIGAGTGVGLSRNVLDAYHWLLTRYQVGDRIALFGFSRGAYTARSLAGMISSCGLIETGDRSDAEVWRQIQDVYDRGYRQGTEGWREGLDFRFDPAQRTRIPVDFIGVWDTVGSLGIPDYLGWLNLLDPVHRYDFHNVTLNPYIRHGRHALAMDERRRPFTPTLWARPYGAGQDVKQVWFPGGHRDVGGGHARMGLSDGALRWMIDEARAAVGLGFHPSAMAQIKADPLDVLHDDESVGGLLQPLVEPTVRPWLEVLLQPRPRAVPRIDPSAPDADLHASVYERHRTPPITGGTYRPTRVLRPGESATVDAFAQLPWNETGLYLDPGEYSFTADGEWRDARLASGPAGRTALNPLREPVRAVGTVAGRLQPVFRWLTGNAAADFLGSPREADLPWLSLVGVVANNADHDRHERIRIGTNARHTVTEGGYLYAYANDAWGRYADNQGSVRLTVTRLGNRTSR